MWYLPVSFNTHRVPLIVIQMIAGFDINAQRAATSLILELQLLSTNYTQFNVIGWTLEKSVKFQKSNSRCLTENRIR